MLIEGVGTDSESAWSREGQFFRRQIDRDDPLEYVKPDTIVIYDRYIFKVGFSLIQRHVIS